MAQEETAILRGNLLVLRWKKIVILDQSMHITQPAADVEVLNIA
jgi:hypothetical protein